MQITRIAFTYEHLEKMAEIRREMLSVLRPDAISRYLWAQNRILGGRRPLDLLAERQFDAILADLSALKEGVYV